MTPSKYFLFFYVCCHNIYFFSFIGALDSNYIARISDLSVLQRYYTKAVPF